MSKDKLPSWDLKVLYRNPSDPRIDLDLATVFDLALKFEKKYRGKITNTTSPKQILMAIKEYEAILLRAVKPSLYAHLVFSANTIKHEHKVLMQKSDHKFTNISKELLFFELALLDLSEAKLKSLLKEKILTNYRHYLEKEFKMKPHKLTEPEEKILADKNLTSQQAFSRLFTQALSRKKFTIELRGKKQILSETAILDLLHKPNRTVRKQAALGFTKGLQEESELLGYISNTLSQDKALEDRLRKFKNPEQSRHLENEIDQATVDIMTKVVADNYKIVSDFYSFKKKLLGMKELFDYDRYAPTGNVDKVYTYENAKNIILSTFGKFSPAFSQIAKEFFDKNWIDAANREGKRGGAFCSYMTPDTHPVVFINFQGKLRDVQTLAHELGHGINAYLMRKQTALNFDTPLTLAETSSVFCEMLLFDQLKDQIKDKKEKQAFYMDKIAGIIATVFRQVSMYKFEQSFHKDRALKGELSVTEINVIWRKSQKEMFGNSVTLTSNYDLWWSYIPHFIESPFYVYAYAFGELLTLSLYAKYKEEGHGFVTKYLKFLEAGSSGSPEELLKPLGINLKDLKFWQQGIDIIREMLVEAKRL